MPDVIGNSTTSAVAPLGTTVYGVLETAGDHDWYRVDLVAGVTYEFRLHGFGLNDLIDPRLRLIGADGVTEIANVDNSDVWAGANLDSRIVFTATQSGTYFLDASGNGAAAGVGNYILTAVPQYVNPAFPAFNGAMQFTADEIAWQLINNYHEPDYRSVAFAPGADHALSVNISALSGAGQALAVAALRAWTDVTGIDFIQVVGAAEINFHDNGPGVEAYSNWNATGSTITGADVMITTGWLAQFGTTANSYSFETYIHEIGHALGLGHAGNYNATAEFGVPGAPGASNYYVNDSLAWSIMSYMQAANDEFTGPGDVNTVVSASFRYMLTPAIADMIAIQTLYGASTTTRLGDTIYGYNSNAGGALNAAASFGAAMAMTIVDNGGSDTLDFSQASADQVINLNAETFSNVLGGIANLSIARGTVIEAALAGGGADILFGNSSSNTLEGGDGSDLIFCGGQDFCWGGNGRDWLVSTNTISGWSSLFGGFGADWFTGDDHTIVNDFAIDDLIIFFNTSLIFTRYYDPANPIDTVTVNGMFLNFAATLETVTVYTINAPGISDPFNPANSSMLRNMLLAGTAGFNGFSGYTKTQFDSNDNAAWWTIADAYTNSNLLDTRWTHYDAGEAIFAAFTDFDQANAATWSHEYRVYSADNIVDYKWLYYDSGQVIYSTYIDYDQGNAGTWNFQFTVFSAANVANYKWIYYDAGQASYASYTDYDQANAGAWNSAVSVFSAPNVLDSRTVYYDPGQAIYATVADYDQANSGTWNSILYTYSALNVLDTKWVYFDAGQVTFATFTNYDQSNSGNWNFIFDIYSALNVLDARWTYYDAGQAMFATHTDYDQANAGTWNFVFKIFSAANVLDTQWTYFDAGQPTYAVFTDFDQANSYAWSQHVITYDTPGHVLTDVYI